MKRINLAFLGILVLFAFFSILNAGTITVPTTAYFGIPAYETYISFDSIQTFEDAYRSGNIWTFDEFGLSVENANMTVTTFFESHIFGCTLEGSSISTTIVHAPSEGEPTSVEGADDWDWDPSGDTTITVNSHPRDITITYGITSGDPDPTPLDVLSSGEGTEDIIIDPARDRWRIFLFGLGIFVMGVFVYFKVIR